MHPTLAQVFVVDAHTPEGEHIVPALPWNSLDKKAVDTVRVLAADAVQKAGHGHPGTAMSLAPAAYLLFQNLLRHDPSDPHWVGRDRFILSPGHSSLTLYLQLYLSGYGLELEDIENLRVYGSLTPGHPEYGHTPGVEITTGPLGQGLASSVGFAYAARYERGLFDPEAPAGTSPFDHTIWVIASDGDLQEGVTSEASSLAGTQELGNLVVLYDDNHISIEDDTNIAFTEDVLARYEAYGWHTQRVDWLETGTYQENVQALYDALLAAKAETSRPSIVSLRTIIGWPAPNKQNTGAVHGSALGADEVAALKEILGFDPDRSFDVDPEVLAHAREVAQRGASAHAQWQEQFDAWAAQNPERKTLFDRVQAGELPAGLREALPVFSPDKAVSTRSASGKVLNAIAPHMPELWGGSADLAGSNNTTISGADSFGPASRSTKAWTASPYGRVLHFGIREHAMGSILNGITLHGHTRAYGGTFLIFSDYQRPAIRLAALMQIPTTFVWTHDSIGLGEDGPTHQPVEQLASLRAIPNLEVVRPADANEVAWAWYGILSRRKNPAGIVLTRQNIPVFDRSGDFSSAEGTLRGAYTLVDASTGNPQVILLGTGSEVSIAVDARAKLEERGIPTRVVSVPCFEWFAEQDEQYKETVLPSTVTARVSIEAGIAQGWEPLVGPGGTSVSLEHYGASGAYDILYQEFGLTPEAMVSAATALLEQND